MHHFTRRTLVQAAVLAATALTSVAALAQAPIIIKFSHVVAPDLSLIHISEPTRPY